MASKVALFLLASFLLVSTRVSSQWHEEILHEDVASPSYKTPPPPPPIKVSPPPPPVKVLPPPPPIKATTPPPPVEVLPPPPPTTPAPKTKLECSPLCVERCKLHSRKRLCMRACMTCCDRCKCVPPGQYGNKEKCGKCYTDMTTHGGKSKCP
ncbi:gibberellin-regulated 14-like [Olea europaea subsp. europaea]|uniref:Gibberellin-regulated 14-like n=1 Tax=Olea europaea subsp. europaea TaxID=158383 RepID=A0A8S0PYM0_OLEEU|nr:gibberellin-regulated 14-like [Olea europaea subsp. europaea]